LRATRQAQTTGPASRLGGCPAPEKEKNQELKGKLLRKKKNPVGKRRITLCGEGGWKGGLKKRKRKDLESDRERKLEDLGSIRWGVGGGER